MSNDESKSKSLIGEIRLVRRRFRVQGYLILNCCQDENCVWCGGKQRSIYLDTTIEAYDEESGLRTIKDFYSNKDRKANWQGRVNVEFDYFSEDKEKEKLQEWNEGKKLQINIVPPKYDNHVIVRSDYAVFKDGKAHIPNKNGVAYCNYSIHTRSKKVWKMEEVNGWGSTTVVLNNGLSYLLCSHCSDKLRTELDREGKG